MATKKVSSKKLSGKKVSDKKVSGKKLVVTEAVVTEPVVTEPVVTEPVVTDSVVTDSFVDEYSEISSDFTSLVTQLRSAQTMLRDLTLLTTRLEKRVVKVQRVLIKKASGKQRRKKVEGAPPSGFSKPGPVSDELRTFLKIDKDDLIARTEVTKRINAYCKEHDLQDIKDKRKLLPDATLKKLLRVGKGDELTFFNLQKYMKVHFPNKEGVYPTA